MCFNFECASLRFIITIELLERFPLMTTNFLIHQKTLLLLLFSRLWRQGFLNTLNPQELANVVWAIPLLRLAHTIAPGPASNGMVRAFATAGVTDADLMVAIRDTAVSVVPRFDRIASRKDFWENGLGRVGNCQARTIGTTGRH